MMKPSPEYVRKILRYDPETGNLFWLPRDPSICADVRASKSWNTRYAGKEAFTANNGNGYRVGAINSRNFLAHHVVWVIVHGEWPDEIDHRDGNRGNNREANLFSVSRIENTRNKKMSKYNTTGVTGVYFNKNRNKWMAAIGLNDKMVFLGSFDNFDDAVLARHAAEVRFGYSTSHGRRL